MNLHEAFHACQSGGCLVNIFTLAGTRPVCATCATCVPAMRTALKWEEIDASGFFFSEEHLSDRQKPRVRAAIEAADGQPAFRLVEVLPGDPAAQIGLSGIVHLGFDRTQEPSTTKH